MEFGTGFPLASLGDIVALRDVAQALDENGFDFVSLGGHVLTAPAERYPERPLFTYASSFRDPIVLFSNLAATTKRLRFRTSVLLLPMFPTVLVAKQAADLALLSDNRFELGVGIGWQDVEYSAMGQALRGRHLRLEEQIKVLRLLWSEPFVTFHGRFHDIDDLGLGQRPTRPIPILIGSGSQPELLARVGNLADGWLPLAPVAQSDVATIGQVAAAAGRPAPGVTGRLVVGAGDQDAMVAEARRLVDAGAAALALSSAPDLALDKFLATLVESRALLVAALDGR